jgi:hypothetical protein
VDPRAATRPKASSETRDKKDSELQRDEHVTGHDDIVALAWRVPFAVS